MATHASDELLKLTIGYWASRAIYAAAKLGLVDHLATGEKSAKELSELTNCHVDSLARMLRFLVELEVLDMHDKRYIIGRLGAALKSESMHNLVLLYGEEFHKAWDDILHTLATGETAFGHVFGSHMYDYFATHSDAGRRFDRAMTVGNFFFTDLLWYYDFSDVDVVVDVGGGTGALLLEILHVHPQTKGLLVDVEHVIERARREIEKQGFSHRIHLFAGDFCDHVPGGGDVYILSRILHGRDDDACIQLLRNCHEAMRAGTDLIVLERVIATDRSRPLAVWFDVHMMAVAGGRERTGDEYRKLLNASGFTVANQYDLSSDVSAVVARRT